MSINITLIFPIYSSLTSLISTSTQVNDLDPSLLSNLEIIIINDCSPHLKVDSIMLLLKSLPNEVTYNYFHLSVNSGPGFVRNFGINKAISNKYISFIDDDDVPNISNIIKFSNNSFTDIVISPLSSENNSFKYLINSCSRFRLFYYCIRGYLKTVSWNKLYGLTYIRLIHANFSHFRLFEDELFFLALIFSKPLPSFIFADKPFVNVIKRQDSRSRNFTSSELLTYVFVQYENLLFTFKKPLLFFIFWFIFFLPKSFISVFISYLRSFYYRRIRNL